MIKRLVQLSAASLLTLFAVSCGRGADEAGTATSETLSLVSFPCQEYGQNLGDTRFHCAVFNVGHRSFNILFQLEGMNDFEKAKMKEALTIAANRVSDYYVQAGLMDNTKTDFIKCVERRADRELDPKGSKISITFPEKARKIVWAITSLQFGFEYHVNKNVPVVVQGYIEQRENNLPPLAHAEIGNDAIPANGSLDFGVNIVSLSRPDLFNVDGDLYDYSSKTFAGALVHEMLHRKGYTHAVAGHSVGPLVYEFGNCITDNNYGLSLTSVSQPPVD
ncbi:MAG: hypothetical protein EOP07_14490 [Proteobacteria bacterium]|nr:MAG: hypothetical protein EOP07_14490 [Pseudomonadota bacterium]